MLVHHFGPAWKIFQQTIGQVCCEFCADIHGSQRMNHTDFSHLLTFLLAPLAGQKSWFVLFLGPNSCTKRWSWRHRLAHDCVWLAWVLFISVSCNGGETHEENTASRRWQLKYKYRSRGKENSNLWRRETGSTNVIQSTPFGFNMNSGRWSLKARLKLQFHQRCH